MKYVEFQRLEALKHLEAIELSQELCIEFTRELSQIMDTSQKPMKSANPYVKYLALHSIHTRNQAWNSSLSELQQPHPTYGRRVDAIAFFLGLLSPNTANNPSLLGATPIWYWQQFALPNPCRNTTKKYATIQSRIFRRHNNQYEAYS
jgi:hypothetical protein